MTQHEQDYRRITQPDCPHCDAPRWSPKSPHRLVSSRYTCDRLLSTSSHGPHAQHCRLARYSPLATCASMWGMAKHMCLQATHRVSQPCQHPGSEEWVVRVTRPRATCHEQPWATSERLRHDCHQSPTYWVRHPRGLEIAPPHVVVNGNPWTVPDANLRLPAPGLRTDGPVRPRTSALGVQAEAADWKISFSTCTCTRTL